MERDLWGMAFQANADSDISNLSSLLDAPARPAQQPDTLNLEPSPLPVVVSPRPGEGEDDDVLGPEFRTWRPDPVAQQQTTAETDPSDDGTMIPGPDPSASAEQATLDSGTVPSASRGIRSPGEMAPGIAAARSGGAVASQIVAGGGKASRYAALIEQVSREEGVPADVLAALIDTEQSGEDSVSPAGARGIMQVVPGQGYDLPGEDARDPLTSIRQGARAVKDKYRHVGTWEEAGRAYFGYGTDAGGMTTSRYGTIYDQHRARYQGASPNAGTTTPAVPSSPPAAVPAPSTPSEPAPSAGGSRPPIPAGVRDPVWVRGQWDEHWEERSYATANPGDYQIVYDPKAGGAPQAQMSALDEARVANNGGDGLMLRGPLSQQPELPPDEQPFDPRDADSGLRELPVQVPAVPQVPAGGQDDPGVPSTEPLPPPRPYAPDVVGEPGAGRFETTEPTATQQMVRGVTSPAARVYGEAISEANRRQDEDEAALNARWSARGDEFAIAARVPVDVVRRAFGIANAVLMATPEATADTVDAVLSAAGIGRASLGIDVPVLGRIGVADIVDLGPATNIGAGRASGALTRAVPYGTGVAGAVERGTGAAVGAAGQAIREGAEAVGRGTRALGEEGARQMLDLTPQPRMIQSGTALASPPHVYSPEPPAGASRRYHGTASAFDAADPARFDENGLYGPGYYTTSDPRVASSYAATRDTQTSRAQAIEQMIEDAERRIGDPNTAPADAAYIRENGLPYLERELADARREPPAGPNVRAVDIPKNLTMLDADAPFTPEVAGRVEAVIRQLQRTSPEVGRHFDDALLDMREWLGRSGATTADTPTNDWLYQALASGAERAGYWNDDRVGRGLATEVLERAGFDGIVHKGGQRVPMLDDAGNLIEHDVTIVFPGSINKVRNAFSGTQGGAFIPFDPASAALGAGAGAMSGEPQYDAEGNLIEPEMDPLRAGAGMVIGALGGTPAGRRVLRGAARRAQNTAPPNLLELMQGFRFSWGMLGNFSTGAVNAMGGPVEIALGLPSEVFRMGVLRQRPAAAVYEATEMASGLREGVRDFLGTIIGRIPQAVRNSPDFRPPLSERMQGTAGKVAGHIIDAPGRITSQAPDSLWAPVLRRWGRAREAANMMAENGTSRLRPDEQIKEMHRLLHNPTPAEAARLDAAQKAWQEEMSYKGDPGSFEGVINTLVRGSASSVATAADPAAKQVHEALGSFVMPFLGTIWKLHKLSASRVPVIGALANRSLAMDEKVSRQVVGAALGLYLADRAAQGLITGPGPSDPDEAALVNKDMPPRHTYLPAIGWVPNDYFGSAGPYLNAVGGYYDARRYATEKEKADADKMGERTAKDMLRAFERFPVAQSLQTLITMAESPTKGVTDFLAGAGSSLVPAPYKTYAGSQDPYIRTTDRDAGFAGQLTQKAQARTGIMRQDLPIAQDRFGRDVKNERQGLAAFGLNVKQPQNDPMVQAFRDAGVQPGMPKKEITPKIEGVKGLPPIDLTPKEQRDWNAARGRKLQELAGPRLTDPQFLALPKDRRAANFEKMVEVAGEYADGVLQSQIGGPEITRRVRTVQERKKAS